MTASKTVNSSRKPIGNTSTTKTFTSKPKLLPTVKFVAKYPKLLNPVSSFTEIRAERLVCFEKQIIKAEKQFKIPQQE